MTTQQASSSSTGLNLAGYQPETEVNDDFASADVWAPGSLGFYGALETGVDTDIFALDLAKGDSLSIRIHDGLGGCSTDADFQIQVFDVISSFGTIEGKCPLFNGVIAPLLGMALRFA